MTRAFWAPICGEQAEVFKPWKGEMDLPLGTIAGEMSLEDVPLAPGIDLAKLKEGDNDPLEVVVEIPEAESKRKWYYTGETMQSIARQVNSTSPNGFLGRQKAEDVSTNFPDPVTHWIGAVTKEVGGKVVTYVRGLVDKDATKLKRWIRTGRISEVSIFGMPKLRVNKGKTEVIDYNLMSIDWTPKGRPGMPTRIVAVGEMATEGGEDVTKAEVLKHLGELVTSGEMTKEDLEAIVGEMFKVEGTVLTGEMAEVLGEMATDKAAVEKIISDATAYRQNQHKELVAKVLGEKVTSEAARGIVGEMINISIEMTEEQIAGEIDATLAKDSVKNLISNYFTDTNVGGSKTNNKNNAGTSKIKRVSI